MRQVVFIVLLVFLAASPCPAAAQQPVSDAATATDARLAGDSKRTRLIVDLSDTVDFRAFMLSEPDRVVVDLPQIAFTLPPEAGKQARGLVSAFRFGMIAAGKSRMVLDLGSPAIIDKAFVLDAADGEPARLVVDLVAADRVTLDQRIAAQTVFGTRPADRQMPPALVQPNQAGLPVVVLDPGHGGIDAGATTAKGEPEKAIVLGFARTLAEKIEATGRYKAVLTRDGDSFISLSERIGIAHQNNAALFISIHADTLPDPFGVRGATIYTLSDTASDAAAARYAEKENRADLIAGVDLSTEPDDVADILIDLTRRETRSFSNHFAKVLIDEFKTAATLNKNPHRSAGFKVLRAPDIPSVLLELGYLSNSQDTRLLLSDEWRSHAADAVLVAINGFFASKGRDLRDTSN